MAVYKYIALKNNKELFERIIEASDDRDAREKIRNSGYIPVKVYLNDDDGKAVLKPVYHKKVHLSLKEKRLFTTSLQSMLASGIPVIEALGIMEKNLSSQKLCKIAGETCRKITEGYSFTKALESYSESFGDVYMNLCHAGEMSGELDKVLERLIDLLKKQQAVTSKIVGASIYPAILLVIIFGLLLLLGNYVFPLFVGYANNNGIDIPVETSMLIGIIEFFRHYWLIAVILGCGTIYGIIQFFKTPPVKSAVDSLLLGIPVVKNFVQYKSLANFTAVLQVSYDSGIPLTQCVVMAKDSVDNYVLKKRCEKFEAFINKGMQMSEASQMSELLPPDLQPMIVMGEKSGKLGEMLKEMSGIIDKKVFETIDNLSALTGPAFLIIMAVIVAFVAIAFLKFYYGMLGSF